VPHFPVDVQELGADFLVFSAHKMCGPTGIGILYGRQDLLEKMPPFMGGGDMIKRVYLRTFTPNELPHKFEAGTPAIAEAFGFGVAVDYLESIGLEAIHAHEKSLVNYAMDCLEEIPGVKIVGPSAEHREVWSLLPWKTSTRMISHKSWMKMGWQSEPGITVRCRCMIS
jgi:cysteine desulfurase/selenocysteine lyase